MKIFLLISSIVIATVSSGPVYVEELEDYVTSKDDKNELKRLEDDDYMIRGEKQQRLNMILARQPQNVQQRYYQEMQRERANDQREDQAWQQRMQQRGLGNLAAQLQAIDNDMNISDADAKQRKQQLKRQQASNVINEFNDDDIWS